LRTPLSELVGRSARSSVGCSQNSLTSQNEPHSREYPQVKSLTTHSIQAWATGVHAAPSITQTIASSPNRFVTVTS
jgi:hypothetical protein